MHQLTEMLDGRADWTVGTHAFTEVALPEDEAMTKVNEVGGTFAATKGSNGLMVADLTPGEYIALCFTPAGTSIGDDGEFVEGPGAPHFTEGMQHEFAVAG
jgi:hypothetical protein